MVAIVGIEDADEIAIRRQLKPASQSGMRALILLHDKVDARIFNRPNDFDGVVLGSIVDDDQLLRRQILLQNRLDRLSYIPRVVIGGDYTGYLQVPFHRRVSLAIVSRRIVINPADGDTNIRY